MFPDPVLKPNPVRGPQRGITLAEACCAMAIVAILVALGAPASRELLDSRRLEGVAWQLASDLRLARTEAIARHEAVRVSLHVAPGGTCYVVHTGPADGCRCLSNGPAWCEGGAHAIRTVQLSAADRVRLESNVASMLFDPQRGTASPAGTLRLTDPRDRALHAIVNLLGRVRTCSPDARVAGYRAC